MSSQHVPIVDKPWGHEKWLVNNEKEKILDDVNKWKSSPPGSPQHQSQQHTVG